MRRRDLLWAAVGWLGVGRAAGAAQKPAGVTLRFERLPTGPVKLRRRVRLVLRVTASEHAPDVVVRLVPTAGVEVPGAAGPWRLSLRRGESRDLAVTVRAVADGRWTLGASATNTQPDDVQVTGAVVVVRVADGRATFAVE